VEGVENVVPVQRQRAKNADSSGKTEHGASTVLTVDQRAIEVEQDEAKIGNCIRHAWRLSSDGRDVRAALRRSMFVRTLLRSVAQQLYFSKGM
jgi:hypothetical protein